jgi:phage portal protein BeeE
VYQEGGLRADSDFEMAFLLPEQVAHFAPTPDPQATYRGMSWITPVIREIQNDNLMSRHKSKYFENGATPNFAVKFDPTMTPKQFKKLKAMIDEEHSGVDQAYKALYLGGGADITPLGANLKQIEFKAVQGHGETRIAAAAGVPPIIVGLSEGLEAATYSNYGQARRRFADGGLHPLWQNAAGSLQRIVQPPRTSTRLWYDARDIPFLREDEKDAAEIKHIQAKTMKVLVDAGYTSESVRQALITGDYGLLEHSGLYSVQLQIPGTQTQLTSGGEDE